LEWEVDILGMQQDQDLDLVLKCKAGEKENFAALYDKYSGKIYNFIYFRVHHKQIAEDLTGQAFFKALERIGQMDPQKGKFSSWLFQIAKNCVIDHFRTGFGTEDIESAFDISSSANLQRDAEIAISMEKVFKYLEKLDKEQKEILIMKLWDGFTYREIAEILGIGESKAKMTLARTLAKMQKEMPLIALMMIIKSIIEKI
jgi:RNA polymerase sigma-70 factor, ECF subfamily